MSDLFLRPLFTWRSAVASEHGPSNPTMRHVLLTLSLHMSERGDSCFPSMETLSTETGLSLRSVKEHIAQAATDGWIAKRERRMRNGQGWRRMEYFAQIPADVSGKFHGEQGGAPDAPGKGGAPTAPAHEGGAPDAKGGAPDSKKVVHQLHLSTSRSTSKNSPAGAPPGEPAPAEGFAILIPLVGKQGYYGVTAEKLQQWTEAFPAIDVMQHLRVIRQWNIDNPANRKTLKGVERHIFRWLAREQDTAPRRQAQPGQPARVSDHAMTCTEPVGDGKLCGMPGKAFGSECLCEGHRHKRLGNRGIPSDVSQKLNALVRRRVVPA